MPYRYRKQKWKPRRQLHPLYEQILRNHLHLLPQKKLAALRNLYEQLPDDPADLTPQYLDDTWPNIKPAARGLLDLKLDPIFRALGRPLMTVKTTVKTTNRPPHFQEVLEAVIVMMKAKRETQNQTLLSRRNIKRAIGEYFGISRKKVSYHLVRLVDLNLYSGR